LQPESILLQWVTLPIRIDNFDFQSNASEQRAGHKTIEIVSELPLSRVSEIDSHKPTSITYLDLLRSGGPPLNITEITEANGPEDPFRHSAQRASYPAQARAVLTKAFL
jgi:hypothetical protein